MAHVKKPGPGSKSPLPSAYPPSRPSNQETNQCPERQECEFIKCPAKESQKDPPRHFPPSVSAPEDMEDTGSEYDNVGSDVEQDYDEVLRLPREGAAETRYYKAYSPEEPVYLKHHAVTENINENSSGAARLAQDTQVIQPSQPQTQPSKPGPRSTQSGPNVRAAAAKCSVGKGQENSYFFNDADDIEEVLVGVKFIEDIEEQEQKANPQVGEVRECLKMEKVVETDRVGRSQKNPDVNKKLDTIKEKNSKGRGRRGNGEHTENHLGKPGSTISSDQRPRSNHNKRTKARPNSDSTKPHPPPRQHHPPSQPPAPKREAAPPPPPPPPPPAERHLRSPAIRTVQPGSPNRLLPSSSSSSSSRRASIWRRERDESWRQHCRHMKKKQAQP